MNARSWLLALALVAFGASAANDARAREFTLGAQYRYWAFADGNDLRDPVLYAKSGAFDAQVERWLPLRGNDQTRVEAGAFVKDARRSAYSVRWRHEAAQERLWFGTEQVVGARTVARLTAGPLLPHDGGDVTFVWEAGADVYWGSYSFAGATAVRDPREGGLWSWPLRARFASERNDWLQLTAVPADRRTFGWAIDGKWRVLRAGIERNSRFDFTTRDNVIFTLGVERTFGAGSR